MNKDQATQKGTQGGQHGNPKRDQKGEQHRQGTQGDRKGMQGGQKDDKARQGAQRDQLDDQGRQRHMGHGEQKSDKGREGGMGDDKDEELGRPVKVGQEDHRSRDDRPPGGSSEPKR